MSLSLGQSLLKRVVITSAMLLLVVSIALAPLRLQAQSSSRNVTPTPSTSPGSGDKSSVVSSVPRKTVLNGYCPVCVVEMKKWVKGSPRFSVQQDGSSYLFPGEEQRQMFLKNPSKYAPALGGDCVVAKVEMGKRMPGSLQHGTLHDGRVYLFANAEAKQMFRANPTKYASADLALQGQCAVCRTEMGQAVPGDPKYVTIYDGMRYLFPGADQQKMFKQNPLKYKVSE